MDIPLQVTYRAMPHSEALDQRIRERAAKLDQFNARITRCRVTIEQTDHRRRSGRQFCVRVDLHVPPRHDVAVTRDHDEDVFVALRDAFDAAERQLKELHHEK